MEQINSRWEEIMEQNIGQFIQELRKAKNMTQKDLAEMIGVSDKTISKWENGNSIPDTSILLSLCQALDISVNELVSCKKLPSDEYSSNAEVNMMKLLRKNEEVGRYSKGGFIVGIVLAVLTIAFMYISTAGVSLSLIYAFIDLPSLIILLLACSAVALLSGAKDKLTVLKVIQKTLIPVGAFTFFFSGIIILARIDDLRLLGPNLAVAVLTLLYALLAYVILIPIISRLENKN